IGSEATRVFGDPDAFAVEGADAQKGAFVPPMLFHCADPDAATHVHDTEAFGPVSTIMPYRDTDHAIALLNKGKGSLVASIITRDGETARDMVMGAGAFHGRLYFNNRDSMAEATGHGAPLPHMVHGGPGRAGGGEELGGVRGVMHY
ncbi:aldehyde dehydrogenase family protein, partial [Pseudomonas aeruginosa]|uniref:aldehyde dehydrogenase family protein n=2 Tax=Pseudomonadota TaxID=1224 RepID=UPI0011BF80DE